jgi:hypothetical protein
MTSKAWTKMFDDQIRDAGDGTVAEDVSSDGALLRKTLLAVKD